MRLAIVQTNPMFGEVDKNLAEAIAWIESTEANLFVLPELFNTGYNFVDVNEVSRLAEPSDGRTAQALIALASRKSCYIVYGFAEQAANFYNSAALVGPDGMIGIYRKVHLYYRENIFFAPGDLGFPVFDLPFGRVGMMVCFDWFYPESARSLALQGAQVIAHPSNLVLPHCPDAMITRCLENRIFAATANRIGTEDRRGTRFRYIGKSGIVSPRGEVLTRLEEHEPGIAVVEIDPVTANDKRLNEFNDLFDGRRPDVYSS